MTAAVDMACSIKQPKNELESPKQAEVPSYSRSLHWVVIYASTILASANVGIPIFDWGTRWAGFQDLVRGEASGTFCRRLVSNASPWSPDQLRDIAESHPSLSWQNRGRRT